MRAFARTLFLVYEIDPDYEVPARPGLFHFQGDAKW